MPFCRSFFDSSPSASESRGGTAAIETKTEDDVQSDIVGKSFAPNVFLSHKFFPRWRTSRVVNSTSVHVKRLDNTFSESLLPCFYNNHLIVKALFPRWRTSRVVNSSSSSKLLCFSSFDWNSDLEANTDTTELAKAMDRQVDADQQNACVLQHVNEYKWTVSFNIVWIFPLYQSSIGYNSDCMAVISTKFHPQAFATMMKSVNIAHMKSVKLANMKSVKIVQHEPTKDTKGK